MCVGLTKLTIQSCRPMREENLWNSWSKLVYVSCRDDHRDRDPHAAARLSRVLENGRCAFYHYCCCVLFLQDSVFILGLNPICIAMTSVSSSAKRWAMPWAKGRRLMEVALNSWTGKPTHLILLAQAEVTIVTNRNDARRDRTYQTGRLQALARSCHNSLSS